MEVLVLCQQLPCRGIQDGARGGHQPVQEPGTNRIMRSNGNLKRPLAHAIL